MVYVCVRAVATMPALVGKACAKQHQDYVCAPPSLKRVLCDAARKMGSLPQDVFQDATATALHSAALGFDMARLKFSGRYATSRTHDELAPAVRASLARWCKQCGLPSQASYMVQYPALPYSTQTAKAYTNAADSSTEPLARQYADTIARLITTYKRHGSGWCITVEDKDASTLWLMDLRQCYWRWLGQLSFASERWAVSHQSRANVTQ